MKIAFLVSGNGGNLKFIHSCIKHNFVKDIELIAIGEKECGAIDYSRKNDIDNYIVRYSRKNNAELIELLIKLDPDYIITNFHKILDKKIVDMFYGKLVNLHYSLLPSFGGLIGEKPILEAINKGCKFIGSTVHYVDYEVDSGEILIQGITDSKGSSKEIINRVFQIGCLCLLNIIIDDTSSIYDESSNNRYNNCFFNPELKFDITKFDDNFWTEISQL